MIENQYGIHVNIVQNLEMISHSGRQMGFISQTFSVPEDRVRVVYMTNHDRTPPGILTKDIMAIVYNKPFTLPEKIERKAIPVDSEFIAEIPGIYEPTWEKSWTFTVFRKEKGCFMTQ